MVVKCCENIGSVKILVRAYIRKYKRIYRERLQTISSLFFSDEIVFILLEKISLKKILPIASETLQVKRPLNISTSIHKIYC